MFTVETVKHMRQLIFGVIAFRPPSNDNYENAEVLQKKQEEHEEFMYRVVWPHLKKIIANGPRPLTRVRFHTTLKEVSDFSSKVSAIPLGRDITKFKRALEEREQATFNPSDLFWQIPDLPDDDFLRDKFNDLSTD